MRETLNCWISAIFDKTLDEPIAFFDHENGKVVKVINRSCLFSTEEEAKLQLKKLDPCNNWVVAKIRCTYTEKNIMFSLS